MPELPPSVGFRNIVTARDVFSRYFFAFPTSNQDSQTISKVIKTIMGKHNYLPTTLFSDKGSAFRSHLFKEVACVLGIILRHATTKHSQTIGMLEWSHAWIKEALNVETAEPRSLWPQYISIGDLNYNTSYHGNIGCEPSSVFHGRIPCFVLGLKMGVRPQKKAHLNLTNRRSCSWTNRKDFPRCPQKSHASIYQMRSL